MARTRHALRTERKRRRALLWIVLAFVALVISACTWVAVRGLLAKQSLEDAVPLASQYKEAVIAGDNNRAIKISESFSEKVDAAASLTGDPVWKVAEIVPGVGPNLRAFSEAAAVAKSVADHAVSPLTQVLQEFNLSSLKPTDGAFDLDAIHALAAPISDATAVVSDSTERAAAIDTGAVLPPVRSGIVELQTALGQAREGLTAVNRAAQLLPTMLGGEGQRTYFLMFQNPAELRATGGIPSAGALVEANDGKIELVRQISSQDFPRFDDPVVELPEGTASLYGDITGRYLQDVNLTPRFPLSAQLASTMWSTHFGADLDGVLSVDPVTLSYILKATGPIELATGDTLTADNAVQLLLSEVYARYPDPEVQDAFFASAAATVFERVSAGQLDVSGLMNALAQAGDERRVYVWSAHKDEQKLIEETTLAGTLPASSAHSRNIGVYFNDATGAKMDYYLDINLNAGSTVCRDDERPYYVISVTLKNNAPKDAASSLPEYVTGGGAFGVAPGSVKTQVNVYAPEGFTGLGMLRDGEPTGYRPGSDLGYAVSQAYAELAPGESTVLEFAFLGAEPFNGDLGLVMTPAIEGHIKKTLTPTCDFALW